MPDRREHKSQPSVTVLTGDEGTITVARSMLEALGIPSAISGSVQNTYGAGASDAGLSPLFGPAALEVPEEFADEARRLLRGLRTGSRRRYVRRDRLDRPRRR